jgi:GST-like protein
VLDHQLAGRRFIAGESYTIADIAIWSWYGALVLNQSYANAAEFLDVASYAHMQRWAAEIAGRPAVIRGRRVNRTWGQQEDQLRERHSAGDFGG